MYRPADALPTGIVTFLMTDIEGSTQAWQAAPDTMTASVSRHYEILAAGIEAHGGRRPEEQGEGDSVVGVFERPSDAVAAALDTQLALRRELPGLAVRMSLHTGEAMLRDDKNYVGLSIIRCARIRASGHGGQILVSDATKEAVQHDLPPAVRLLDLGVYGLRGLTGRDRIWQLEHDDLPSTFPHLKAGASAAGNLPSPISSFVGRRSELAAISTSLEAHRLVTLTGAAGIGKSRLAVAAADSVANALSGGAWLVPLSGLTVDDPDAVASTTLQACSIDRVGAEPLEAITAYFTSVAGALLVIDGCEHAPDGVSTLVQHLLARCPDTIVLATGRDPLRVPGEVVHDVGPLPIPPRDHRGGIRGLRRHDAARLFIERATTANADLELSDAAVADIVSICAQLHGVPLGIELAAARVALTSINDLAASLESLVTSSERPLSAALTSPIGWSYHFLDEGSQAALRRLSVFQGPFEIDAATAVVIGNGIDEETAVGSIRTLLDQRLLTVDQASGRIELPSAIRLMAAERLDGSPDRPGAIARHIAWFAALATKFAEAGLAMPDSLLAPDESDMFNALESAMTIGPTSEAYRILIGLGPRWHRLDRETAEAAAAWVAGRTPSDGEENWAGAVSRLCYAFAGQPAQPIHAFAEEARAIAELTGDLASSLFLDFAAAVRALSDGDVGPAERLSAESRRLGVDEIAIAIDQHIAAAQREAGLDDDATARMASLRALLGGSDYEGPIDLTDIDPARYQQPATT